MGRRFLGRGCRRGVCIVKKPVLEHGVAAEIGKGQGADLALCLLCIASNVDPSQFKTQTERLRDTFDCQAIAEVAVELLECIQGRCLANRRLGLIDGVTWSLGLGLEDLDAPQKEQNRCRKEEFELSRHSQGSFFVFDGVPVRLNVSPGSHHVAVPWRR